MKKIAIIGAGISGLFVANLLRDNQDYQVTIYEKNTSIDLDEGYGIQLSTNSIKLLNTIGFNTLENEDRFHPDKIDFYTIKPEKKICDLNISDFNSADCKYTTLKRSKLVKFLTDRLNDNIIKFDYSIEKIEKNDDQIYLTFNRNNKTICDYLIISDGVFSKGKSLISNNQIKSSYNNSIAIRGNILRNKLQNLNENNISLFMGHNFHYVIYPVNKDKENYNFIGILKYQLTAKELENYSLFKEETFIQGIKNKIQNEFSINILEKINNIKCFPVFVSKGFLKPGKNIFFLGDAFFASHPHLHKGPHNRLKAHQSYLIIL